MRKVILQKALLSGVFFVFLDQLLKFLWLPEVCNFGHAFGLDFPASNSVVFGLLLILLFYFISSFRYREGIFFVSVLLIFFGGISNALDRVFLGCVRDIFPFFGWFFWNVADGVIVLGVCGIIIGVWIQEEINR